MQNHDKFERVLKRLWWASATCSSDLNEMKVLVVNIAVYSNANEESLKRLPWCGLSYMFGCMTISNLYQGVCDTNKLPNTLSVHNLLLIYPVVDIHRCFSLIYIVILVLRRKSWMTFGLNHLMLDRYWYMSISFPDLVMIKHLSIIPVSCKINLIALVQASDCPSASEVTLMDMGKCVTLITGTDDITTSITTTKKHNKMDVHILWIVLQVVGDKLGIEWQLQAANPLLATLRQLLVEQLATFQLIFELITWGNNRP